MLVRLRVLFHSPNFSVFWVCIKSVYLQTLSIEDIGIGRYKARTHLQTGDDEANFYDNVFNGFNHIKQTFCRVISLLLSHQPRCQQALVFYVCINHLNSD